MDREGSAVRPGMIANRARLDCRVGVRATVAAATAVFAVGCGGGANARGDALTHVGSTPGKLDATRPPPPRARAHLLALVGDKTVGPLLARRPGAALAAYVANGEG